MNCDTAFDLLTDEHGSRSGALAQHFETCARCRQMQETLAPALEFLTHKEASQQFAAAFRESEIPEQGSRQPFVSGESLRMAEQAAGRLAGHDDRPRAGRRRLAGQLIRYAAVFAAGILLAVALVPDRGQTPTLPAGCTRQAAAENSAGRSADTIQALAHSCTVCHAAATTEPAHERTTSLLRSERVNSWDWLAAYFAEEYRPVDDSHLVAQSQSPADLSRICCSKIGMSSSAA
jgi:hypothetical protein